MARSTSTPTPQTTRARVWDLPTRAFHWTFAILVIVNWLIGSEEFVSLEIHMLIGQMILALVLFRIAWGVVGGRYARFADFVRGPSAVVAYGRYLIGRGAKPAVTPGHNPMGALSVLALLAVVLTMTLTGLFADDDVLAQGPLGVLVSGDTRKALTGLHSLFADLLLVLVVLHVAIVVWYTYVRREDLLTGMISGEKDGVPVTDAAATAAPAVDGGMVKAVVVLVLAAGGVVALVNLPSFLGY